MIKVFEWNVFMRQPSFQANLFVPRSGALGSFLARHSLPLSSFEPADGPKKAPQRTTRVHSLVKSAISYGAFGLPHPCFDANSDTVAYFF